MESESKKIGFFSRVKMAVIKLEDYGMFLGEKTSIAVKYFFLIVLCLAVVISVVETYSLMQMVSKGYDYVKSELPEFSYAEGNLNFSENVDAYDEEYDFYLIADTAEEISEEMMQGYKEKIKSTGIIFLKDKAIYKVGGSENTYRYRDFAENYGINTFDRAMFVQKLDDVGLVGIAVSLFIILIFGVYILQLINVFMDWLEITLFAFVVARICRMAMPLKQAWNISIYTLTLSIILNMVYAAAYYLAGFYTEYFRIVYLLVAYVYVVAVILMIKSDLIKQQIEVSKIVEVQKQVHEEEELPEKEKVPEDKKDKKEPKEEAPEEPIGEEPDGGTTA